MSETTKCPRCEAGDIPHGGYCARVDAPPAPLVEEAPKCTCIKEGSLFCKFPHPCRNCGAYHRGVSCYWHAQGKTAKDKRSDGRTFTRSDGTVGCNECCSGDRCDDTTHSDRDNCSYCLGSGSPAPALPSAKEGAASQKWTKEELDDPETWKGIGRNSEPTSPSVAAWLDVATFVRYAKDPNNGAGLWAVFVGNMPVHHFNPHTATVDRYLLRLQSQIVEFAASQNAEIVKEWDKAEKLLRVSKTRFEILMGRMLACDLDEGLGEASDGHEVSREEIPAWIEEIDTYFLEVIARTKK